MGADRTKALFLAETGGPITNRTIRARLRQHLQAAQKAGVEVPMFTCHDFRRAFATHFYEEYPEKIEVLRLMLGHQFLATTQRYLRPSRKFIEQQMEDLMGIRLDHLRGDE
ncbi:MAG TPA: tyrosine-type recombinase/integrase [Symbiobacteriaceae bacterium]|nr:tyrosine-type recombinase/integrase [Symbiobacteriaceae bacterium]